MNSTNHKHITAIITNKIGRTLLEGLSKEKGIIRADCNFARGDSRVSHRFAKEVEILSVIVEEERAEEIFEYLYQKIKIDKDGNGMIYQNGLRSATEFTLPSV